MGRWPVAGKAAEGDVTLIYEEFMASLRQEGESRATQGGLIPIPELRHRLALERDVFDGHVLRLHSERLVHLLSHVDGENLPPLVRDACIVHNSGALVYWIRWL
jgi:hypothetical protein